MWRRFGKWVAVAFAALAIVHAARLMGTMSNTVELVYSAPSGRLVVTLLDDEQRALRRTEFGATGRSQSVTLPSGRYTVRMEVQDGRSVVRPFTVDGDARVKVSFWP